MAETPSAESGVGRNLYRFRRNDVERVEALAVEAIVAARVTDTLTAATNQIRALQPPSEVGRPTRLGFNAAIDEAVGVLRGMGGE